MANSESLKDHSDENGKKLALICVKYRDHVLFRNSDLSTIKPSIRIAVGWLASESPEVMYLCSDFPADPLSNEQMVGSGFLILKSDVLEIFELRSGKPFKRFQTGMSGQKTPYKMEN